MSENNGNFDITEILQYRKTIATLTCVVFAAFLPVLYDMVRIYPLFWFEPLLLGVIAGVVIGSASAGLYSLLGAVLGRSIAFIYMILVIPDFLATLDLFISVIGSYIGITLPGGFLVVILLSLVISGLFAAFGGMAAGSAMKIAMEYTGSNQEANTESET